MSLLTIYVKGELQSKTKKKHVKQLFLQEVFINDDISDFSPNSDVTGRKERWMKTTSERLSCYIASACRIPVTSLFIDEWLLKYSTIFL